MKQSWTALAVSLLALGVFGGCDDYNNSVQYDTGSTLTNLSPSGIPAQPVPVSGSLNPCPNTPSGQNNPCFTLFIVASGSNPFSNASGVPLPVARWNGKNLATTMIDTTNLSAQVPYSYVTKPGTVAVDVYQPTGQGTGYNGLSNALTFTIYGSANPYPTLSSVSPTSAPYCDSTSAKCASVAITVTGSNFLPTSQNGGSSVTFTGASTYNQETAITVTSISSTGTQMKATIPGTLLCASGTAQINVINPPSGVCLVNCPNLGGGDTNSPPAGQQATTQTFTITNTTPINTCPTQVPPNPNPQVVAEKAAISRDGRYVAYALAQNGTGQILLRDTCLGASGDCAPATRTVSVAADGSSGNAESHNVAMTADGRYVAFSSAATNLVENAPGGRQVYLRDTCDGATASCRPSTQLVSTDAAGKLTGTAAILPAVSASGRFVAFLAVTPRDPVAATSGANGSVAAGWNDAVRQVFVRDTCIGVANCAPQTLRVSVLSSRVADDAPAISRDGRYVGYTSSQDGVWQILLADTCVGAASGCTPSARVISTSPEGVLGNAASHNPAMSTDGRFVAFSSAATNLMEGAPLGRQVYLRGTCVGATAACEPSTMLVSADEQGVLAGTESILPSLSASGRYVAFLAVTTNLSGAITAPNSGLRQVFLRDTCIGASNCEPSTTRISLQPGDVAAEGMKPAGPALAGLAKQIALADAKTATVFTKAIAVDDPVVIAFP